MQNDNELKALFSCDDELHGAGNSSGMELGFNQCFEALGSPRLHCDMAGDDGPHPLFLTDFNMELF